MKTPLYSLHAITRVYGSRAVLDIPELVIEPQKIYGLLGPNGAGKTTLMKILAFMDRPSTGDIMFAGERVTADMGARLRSRVVWVPQSPIMFSGTLAYNVDYPMRIKKVASRIRKERVAELLELVGLSHLAKSPAQKLSGGEAQRASIARALAAGAEVILFDEPTASVDFRARGEIIRLIRMLHEERGISPIVTTHDRSLAVELCNNFITLFDGKLIPERSEEASLFRQGEIVFPARVEERSGQAFIRLERSSAMPKDSWATLLGMDLVGSGLQLRFSLENGGILPVCITDEKEAQRMKHLRLEEKILIVVDTP